jgi:hypothetical protein
MKSVIELATGLLLCWVATSRPAWAEWKTATHDGITVRSRAQSGSAIREFWAEATLAAAIEDVQNAIVDFESHTAFMPHVAEAKYLAPEAADGTRLAYSRLEFPVVTSRDFVIRVTLDKLVSGDKGDEFANHWTCAADTVPVRPGVIRLRINEGSWRAMRVGPEQTRVVYRFRVDPAGWIPAVLANEGSRRTIPSVLRALEAEARKRGLQRRAAAANSR